MPWRNFFKKRRPDDGQLDSELRFHIDGLIQEKIAAGLTAEEARREAMLEFGGREQLKEELRDVHRIATVENTLANIKSGIRLMRKSPGFSTAVVLTLALGIGANSAVFSAINAILLRPLPFPNADELMVLRQLDRKAKKPETHVAPVRLEDWNRLNTTFQAISGWYTQDASETSGVLPEKVTEALVAPRFLQAWGISPPRWGAISLLKKNISADRMPFLSAIASGVVASMQIRMRLASGCILKNTRTQSSELCRLRFFFPDHDVDVWCPSPVDAPYGQSRESTWFTVIGRLKPGVTVAQARANLASVQAQLGRQFPKTDANLKLEIEPLKETTVSGVRRSLWILFGSVSLLLLIACTNIAGLLLARTAEREREISVRFSLGASRASVVAQLLTECFVLALTGSALGLFVAAIASNASSTLAKSLPRVEEITLDWRIVVYTLACAVAATLLCGLLPAIRATRRSIASGLAQASRTQVSTRSPVQWTLAGIQVALAVTLLVGAGLLLRSFEERGRVSPGFEVSHVLTLRISGNWGETGDMRKLTQRMDRTLDELRVSPGVRAAATSATLPGVPDDFWAEIKLEGRAENEGKVIVDSRAVSNGYFATMQIPMLAGEGCRESLKLASVVVNRSFVDSYLSGLPAIGQHLEPVSNSFFPPADIRGVVADSREQGVNTEPAPTIYWCVSAPDPSPYFLVRTQGEPMASAQMLQRKIHSIEPARSVFDIAPLEQHLSDSFAENRLRTILLTVFALTAISLACIGLYGTLSYFVTVRRREVGLRLALGAVRGQIVTRFLLKGLGVSFIGCMAGLCLAAGFARVLSGMLYGVSTADAKTFFFVIFLVLAVAALASLVPALRAARVEPMQVLRDE